MNRKKSVLIGPIIVFFWLSVTLAAVLTAPSLIGAQTGSTVRVDPTTASLDVNDNLDFSIIIDVEPGRNYGSSSFTLEYDSAVLQIESFAVGSGLFGATNIADSGIIRFNALSISGAEGSVVLGSGRFIAIGDGNADLKITINDPVADSFGTALPEVETIDPNVVVVGPTATPTDVPPTNTPTAIPTNTPTAVPTNTPTAVPTNTPTAEPTNTPTAVPTNTPTAEPTNTPTAVPTNTPTAVPTNTPTAVPTNTPTAVPTNTPTAVPTNTPTAVPTNTPTAVPTNTPTAVPTNTPTAEPTNTPTAEPTNTPTAEPTNTPTTEPTNTPTTEPTNTPTTEPTNTPTTEPTNTPTTEPTNTPTTEPTNTPTAEPTNTPTTEPTNTPTTEPTNTPTTEPTNTPTAEPTNTPTTVPPTPTACGPLMQEAEHGTISGSRFVIGDRADASGGQYVYVPDRSGNIAVNLANNSDYVSFCFDVPTDGEYKIQAWVSYDGTQHLSDSFFVQVNDLPTNGYLWDTLKRPFFVEDSVNDRRKQDPVVVNLTAGENIVKFHLREDGALLDKVALVNTGVSPTPTYTPVAPTPTSTATAMPPPTVTPLPPTPTPYPGSCGPMVQEAENGTISGSRFVIGNRADASGGQYVYVPDRSGNISVSLANNLDYVSFCFDVPADGDYTIQGWVSYDGTQHLSDSFFVQVDDLPANGYLWDTLKRPFFVEDSVNDRRKQDPVVVSLTAGQHIVKFHLREDGTLLDKVALEPAN